MNHRELLLSAEKKSRSHFLQLPEDLQDEVIDGLDSGALTLESAAALIRERGQSLSHVALSNYYRAVRRERRLQDARQELTRIIADFSGKPIEEGLQSLANLIIAMAATGLADGTVGIKDIDLGRVLQAMGGKSEGARGRAGDGEGERGREGEGVKEVTSPAESGRALTQEVLDKIRRDIYGLI